MKELLKENVSIETEPKSKTVIIQELGNRLCQSGYTDSSYTEAMLTTEKTHETVVGFGLAIPHGQADLVHHSGMAIMAFPQGTIWDDQIVKMVIALAAKEEDHLRMLTDIALVCPGQEEVNRLACSSIDTIAQAFTAKE